jgi:hypothetical protein
MTDGAMNRLKMWVYVVIVLAAGIVELGFLSRWLTEHAIAQLDHELRASAQQVDARARLLASEAAQLADATAHDPSVLQALAPDGTQDVPATSQAAVEHAARALGIDTSRGLLVATSGRGGPVARAGGANVTVEGLAAVLPGADGARRQGYVIADGTVFYAVGAPAGRGAVAVGLPLDIGWLVSLKTSTGADVTLVVEGKKPQTTLRADDDAPAIVAAARNATGRTVGAGALPSQPAAAGVPLPLPMLPLVFASAPAHRVQALALKGLPAAFLAVSESTAPALAPLVSYEWLSLGVLVVLALIGLVLGLLVTNEQESVVPRALTAAADRIARGDFAARAPELAGSLGTLSSALNRAAEGAQMAHAALASASAAPAAADPFTTPAEPPPAEAASEPPFEPPVEPLREPPVAEPPVAEPPFAEPPPAETASFEPAPPEPPAAEQPPPEFAAFAAAEPPPPPAEEPPAPVEPAPVAAAHADGTVTSATRLETRTEELYKMAAAAVPEAPANVALPAPDAPTEDEEHWQAVYEHFLRVREECGESAEGVPYDRFRLKLQKNRDQLMEKYGCRSVRFQVYVKEGRAALKASPIR